MEYNIKIFMNKLVTFLAVTIIYLGCSGEPCFSEIPFSVDSSLNKTVVPRDGQITLQITLNWLGAPDAIELSPMKHPDCYLLEIVDIQQKNSFELFQKDGKSSVTITYRIKATEPGEGRISYCTIEFTEKQNGIKRLERTKAYDVRVMSPSRYLLRQTANGLVYAAGVVVAGFIIWVVYRIVRRKKKQAAQKKQEMIIEQDDFEHQALQKLTEVRRYKLSGETEKFFDGISSVLHDYMTQRYGVSFTKTTSVSEMNIEQKQELPTKLLVDCKTIIATCSRIKFSGEKPSPEELDRWYSQAEKVIKAFREQRRQHQMEKINLNR